MKSRKLKAKLAAETHLLLDWVIFSEGETPCPLCAKPEGTRVRTDVRVHGRFHAIHEEMARRSFSIFQTN